MSLPPLILIHGYPLDHTMWKEVVPALEGKTRVITPDLPGFGDNPARNDEPSIDLMADDLAELFDFHHIDHAVVAGMSMGGYIALSLAERHPSRIAGLALISTQAVADMPEIQQARRTLIGKVQRQGTRPVIEALLPTMFATPVSENTNLGRSVIEGAANAGVEGICWALEAMARRADRTRLLSRLKIPATVIHGADDKLTSSERARKMALEISGAKYVELPGVGHASPMEAPQAVANALLELLERATNFRLATRTERLPGITIAPSEHGL